MTLFSKLPLIAMLTALAATAQAQYRLHTWENFEDGQIPATMSFRHDASKDNVRVVSYASLGNAAITQGAAAGECGKYGLEFKTDDKKRFLALVSSVSMDRTKLGANGKALYQADVYIENMGNIGHTAAVMAVADAGSVGGESNTKPWNLYRLGVIGGDKAYFSYTSGSAKPQIYVHQEMKEILPATNGWHRIQLLFEGQSNITCYVDGRVTSFSPLVEKSFTRLHPGLFVTAPAEAPLTAYIDNLSIQWTPDPTAPMPESPWVEATAAAADPDAIQWSRDPESAWALSKAAQKPMLVMFYDPASVGYQDLINNVFRLNKDARATLDKFVLLRVDINQLRGGALAKKFNVMRVPTLLVLGADGKERSRVVTKKETAWKDVEPELAKGLTP